MTFTDWAIIVGAWALLVVFVVMGLGAAARERDAADRVVDKRGLVQRADEGGWFKRTDR